jgi:type IV fimbrial biogenesis protein FimT
MRKCKSLGFSLVELLLAILLLGILSHFALGSYANLVSRMRIYTATSTLHSSLLYARSEALRFGGNVIICRSATTQASNPTCDGTGNDSATSAGWGDGWLIFHDGNGDGGVSGSDTLLRVQEKLFATPTQGSITPSPSRKQIKFNSLGQVYGAYLQFAVTGPKSDTALESRRYICIASGGRARVDTRLCNGK